MTAFQLWTRGPRCSMVVNLTMLSSIISRRREPTLITTHMRLKTSLLRERSTSKVMEKYMAGILSSLARVLLRRHRLNVLGLRQGSSRPNLRKFRSSVGQMKTQKSKFM